MEIDLTGLVLPERVEAVEKSADGPVGSLRDRAPRAGFRSYARQLGPPGPAVFPPRFRRLGDSGSTGWCMSTRPSRRGRGRAPGHPEPEVSGGHSRPDVDEVVLELFM